MIEVTLLDYLRALFEEGQKLSELVLEVREILGFGDEIDIDGMFEKLQELRESIYEGEQTYSFEEKLAQEGLLGNGNNGRDSSLM